MKALLTLPYFCSSQLDVMFSIWDVLDQTEHPQHNNLLEDIKNIDLDDFNLFISRHLIEQMSSRYDDKELAKKVIYLYDHIQKAVARAILKEISDSGSRLLPYSSPNLESYAIDDHQLISPRFFEGRFGIQINGYCYELCPSIRGSNSSYWIGQALMKVNSRSGNEFRVRLHPFVEKRLEDYHPMQYSMTVFGKPLSWERLLNLQEADFGRFINEHQNDDTNFTDFVWLPKGDEIHFTCEEIPKEEVIDIRGSRYFHAIFDKQTVTIKHCDGAIRLYNKEQLSVRNQFHSKDTEVRKIGQRIKLFQGDKLSLGTEDFTLLARSFFVWNHDVHQYFEQV